MSSMVDERNALEYIFQNNLRNWRIPVEVSNGILSKMFGITNINQIDGTHLEELADNKIESLIVRGGTDRPGLLKEILAGLSMTDLADSRGDTLEIYNMISLGIGFTPGSNSDKIKQKFFDAISGALPESMGANLAKIKQKTGIGGWRSLMVDGKSSLRTLFEGHIDIDKQCKKASNITPHSLPDECWLCGGRFGEPNKQTKRVCEHVLPVTVASMANMLITGHDNRADVYGAEYKWSHFCCNAKKLDILPVSIESRGINNIMMVINDTELNELVKKITDGCFKEIGRNWGRKCTPDNLRVVLEPAVGKFNEYLNSKAAEGSITDSDRDLIAKLEILFDIVLRPFVVGMNLLKSVSPTFHDLSYERIYDEINEADINKLCRIIDSDNQTQTDSDHILLSIMYLLLIQGKPINDILERHFHLCSKIRLIRAGVAFILHCSEREKESLITDDFKNIMLKNFEGRIKLDDEYNETPLNSHVGKLAQEDEATIRLKITELYDRFLGRSTGPGTTSPPPPPRLSATNSLPPRKRTLSANAPKPTSKHQRRSTSAPLARPRSRKRTLSPNAIKKPSKHPKPTHPHNTRSKGRGTGGRAARKRTRRSSRRLTTPTHNKGGGIGRGTHPRTPRKRAITRKRSGKSLFNSNNIANYKSNNEFILRQTVFMSLLNLTYSMPDEDIKEMRREMELEFIGPNGQTGGSQSRTPRRSSTRKSPSGKTGSKRFPTPLSFNNYKKDAFNNYKKDAFNFGLGQLIISKETYDIISKEYKMNNNKSIPETAEDIAELLKNSLK